LNIKILGLFGALAFAAPVAAVAAPATGLTAHSYVDLTTVPQTTTGAAVAPGDAPAKIEKIWWRRYGFGWRHPYFRYGWRHPYWGGYYAWHRPFWRRRWIY
jgi:hypothetical protein